MSAFKLDFAAKSASPSFSIDQTDFTLPAGQSATVNVHFQPESKNDRVSGKITHPLVISYRDHPQRETIDLVGELSFPNLVFSTQTVDFGCILNNTVKRITVIAKNEGSLTVYYSWKFFAKDNSDPADIYNVFDITPIFGQVDPGQSEKIEFVFYAKSEKAFSVSATCVVEGKVYREILILMYIRWTSI